jgi:NTP pyrophosphatase (non-canonical NTP hydrolase)
MGDIEEMMNKLVQFRDARDWKQFHKPKDLAAAIAIEAGELQASSSSKQILSQ